MRFDAYVLAHNIAISPSVRFQDLVVEVGLPPEWEPFDSPPGMQVWFWRDDPCIVDFGANAVLTMHVAESSLNAGEVFAMLCEQQIHMVPGASELSRVSATASEGPGMAGSMAMNMESQFGAIGSVSLSRIIPAGQQTMIAQLTITSLRNSPLDWQSIWLYVKPGAAAGSTSSGRIGGVPLNAPEGWFK